MRRLLLPVVMEPMLPLKRKLKDAVNNIINGDQQLPRLHESFSLNGNIRFSSERKNAFMWPRLHERYRKNPFTERIIPFTRQPQKYGYFAHFYISGAALTIDHTRDCLCLSLMYIG